MGRPPIGQQAMTSTERSQRRRARLRADRPVMRPDAGEIATLKARIFELEARNDELFRQVNRKALASGTLNRKAFNVITKALHQDRLQTCSKAELDEASRLFLELKPLFGDR